ncbi:DNA polymerase III beta-subunit [Candidatus Blochmanniella floridana]|uniref:Beta sliding clamp n=1 Tax=Blochmanniella floridana TaxID=203907 RepID=Q7VQU9_BLOFL|nr:DNA polymerase III beta-subunit [Candidatus Blochmannia floridanus]
MDFFVERNDIYASLRKVINIIDSRSRLPILKHILLDVCDDRLFITATDLEIEIVAEILLDKKYIVNSVTVPGYKFFEICQNLPENSKIHILLQENRFLISSGCSNFVLSILPVLDFPKVKKYENESYITIPQCVLKKMIKLTQFSMGYQDSRYYLNGICLKTEKNTISMVSTDGYRLSMCEVTSKLLLPFQSVIIPRKGVLEIFSLLGNGKELVKMQVCNNNIYIKMNNYVIRSKLIDSEFPDYKKIFLNQPKIFFEIDRIVLKHALKRASILSNEKLRIVNFYLTSNQLKITTDNFKEETSEEILKILFSYENISISFNVDYLLDVINVVDSQMLKFSLINTVSSVQIEGVPKYYGSIYIIMPVKV